MTKSGNLNHIRSAKDTVRNPSGLIQVSFLQATSELLRKMAKDNLSYIKEMKQELVFLEDASLYIKKRRNGKFLFSCRPEGNSREIGITSDLERVQRLARRDFLNQRIRSAEAQARELQKAVDRTEDARERQRFQAKLTRFADAGIDLASVIFTQEQLEWIGQPFTPNPHYLEDLKYPTKGGYVMRSNAEASLGSELETFGLPYRYDDLVTIHYDPLGDRPFRNSYFADFKVPNLIGGITVHEHLGAFQIERYGENALQRLHDYHTFGIIELPSRFVQHEEITWSFEHDLYDPLLLQKLIQRILLPGV